MTTTEATLTDRQTVDVALTAMLTGPDLYASTDIDAYRQLQRDAVRAVEEMDDEYNGHTNRETWATIMHLSNDYDLYQLVRALVVGKSTNTRKPTIILSLRP